MCVDPVTLGVGMALSGAGSLIGQKDALGNAQSVAAARNAVLKDNLKRQDAFAAENRGAFDTRMGDYAPGVQGQKLATAQETRTQDTAGNISAIDPNAITLPGSSSPAARGAIADRMLAAFRKATDAAKAGATLGGYGDAWQGNNRDIGATGRDINVTNNFSRGQAGLLQPLQDLAEVAAYKPPSIFGPLLQFAGNVVGGGAGRGWKMGSMFPTQTAAMPALFQGVGAQPY